MDLKTPDPLITVLLRDLDVQCRSGLSNITLDPDDVLEIDAGARILRVTSPDREGELVFWVVEWYRVSTRPFRRKQESQTPA